MGLWLSFRGNPKRAEEPSLPHFPMNAMAKDICSQPVVPSPEEDMKQNGGEAERINYLRKIFKPSESGFPETPL